MTQHIYLSELCFWAPQKPEDETRDPALEENEGNSQDNCRWKLHCRRSEQPVQMEAVDGRFQGNVSREYRNGK